jgi:hypothetical protein
MTWASGLLLFLEGMRDVSCMISASFDLFVRPIILSSGHFLSCTNLPLHQKKGNFFHAMVICEHIGPHRLAYFLISQNGLLENKNEFVGKTFINVFLVT